MPLTPLRYDFRRCRCRAAAGLLPPLRRRRRCFAAVCRRFIFRESDAPDAREAKRRHYARLRLCRRRAMRAQRGAAPLLMPPRARYMLADIAMLRARDVAPPMARLPAESAIYA